MEPTSAPQMPSPLPRYHGPIQVEGAPVCQAHTARPHFLPAHHGLHGQIGAALAPWESHSQLLKSQRARPLGAIQLFLLPSNDVKPLRRGFTLAVFGPFGDMRAGQHNESRSATWHTGSGQAISVLCIARMFNHNYGLRTATEEPKSLLQPHSVLNDLLSADI
ncbi:hypothetical protein CFIO01_03431 [Colletotrichum fioriniae PJ7]|uniref:Uncharacterized protein n=1 Tax=Colletotrichum fioriniae PJ7 TaxID=1445577 RepID=A0A010S8D7_9PEZI|nr:hypothetical protein CFIO01_03431 [Colletotrichum fioriniae PJ7]